jgi:hypothetical protein
MCKPIEIVLLFVSGWPYKPGLSKPNLPEEEALYLVGDPKSTSLSRQMPGLFDHDGDSRQEHGRAEMRKMTNEGASVSLAVATGMIL